VKDPGPSPAARSPLHRHDVYAIPIAAACLIYSPLRRITALVNHKALEILKADLIDTPNQDNIPAALQDLDATRLPANA